MASGVKQSSGIIKSLMYQPAAQKRLSQFISAEQADNRAVSGRNRAMGKLVAGEQSRLQKLEEFGDDLAMRRDKLAFSRKIHAQKMALEKEKLSDEESALGIRTAIGGLSVGITAYGDWRNRQEDKLYRQEQRQLLGILNRHIGFGVGPRFDYDPTEEEQ